MASKTVRQHSGSRAGSLERYLPVAYCVIAIALVVLLLPSALRPPPDRAHTAAEFSPDAPPNDQQESILANLNRGSSGTAGAGVGDGPTQNPIAGELPGPGGLGGPVAGPPPPARACPHGIGNPPRQTFVLYSAPCAPAFTGDNGGATYKGVTRDEVRVAIVPATTTASYSGLVPRTQPSNETAQDRTYRVYQQWLNQNFQFYGRYLQLILMNPNNTNASTARATAVAADEQYHAFGVTTSQAPVGDETARRQLMAMNLPWFTDEYYVEHYPYSFSWYTGGTSMVRLQTELICKQLAHRPATFTNDPNLNGKTRKFGMIWSHEFFVGVTDTMMQQELQRQCGEQYAKMIGYSYYTDEDPQNLAQAIIQMRAAGVTTIDCFCDFVAPAALTQAATQQDYFPEWIMPGVGDMDFNNNGQLYDQQQWGHSVGLTTLETMMPISEIDYNRAFKEIDPDHDPDDAVGRYLFHELVMVANAIQLAGPKLTPQTVMSGLMHLPVRAPEPAWAVAGGFGPNDYTYSKYAALVWWDPTATAPDNGSLGAYRYLNSSKRYKLGEMPTGPLGWFHDGDTSAPSH